MKTLTILFMFLITGIIFAQADLDKQSIFLQYRNMPAATQPMARPVRQYIVPSTPSPILVGLEKTDIGLIGTLEDSTKIINVRVGDVIDWNGSNVIDMTLDEMTLSNGVVVKVGNNLRNETVQSLPLAAPYNSLDSGISTPAPVQIGRGRGRGRGVTTMPVN